MTEKKIEPQLPQWLYPTEHAGWCYDQIGAASVAGGVVTGVAVSSVEAAAQTVLGGHALQAAAFIPDPFAAAMTGVVAALLGAAYLMYRHWLPHRELAHVLAECDDLRRDLAGMCLAEQLEAQLELTDGAPVRPVHALTGPRRPLALTAGPGKEG